MNNFLKKEIDSSENGMPNCFAFKLKMEDKYRVCICPRINGKWSEEDIFHVPDTSDKDQLIPLLEKDLDDECFNIVFLSIENDKKSDGIKIVANKPKFLKGPEYKSADLYNEGKFFELVEVGYQRCYLNKKVKDVEFIQDKENPEID